MELQSGLATCSYSEFKPTMGVSVRISLGGPRWWKTPPQAQVSEITPRSTYLRGTTDEEYIDAYTEQLARYGVDRIRERFDRIRQEVDAEGPLVLMCFEKLGTWNGGARKGDWCHRSMFAWWWREMTGEVIPELGDVAPGTPFTDGFRRIDTPDSGVDPRDGSTLF